MKVILLTDVRGLGRKYDIKNVADGYAANFLLPKKLAEGATREAVEALQGKKSEIEAEKKSRNEELLKILNELEGKTLTLKSKANDEGNLFAGIHEGAISDAIKKEFKLEIPKGLITLSQPIKKTGEYEITVSALDKKVIFKLSVEK